MKLNRKVEGGLAPIGLCGHYSEPYRGCRPYPSID